MNPNWSKLAALFRTLTILGASSFVGAIALPLATDGTLPTTWQAWRPILAVAGSAAIVAEFIWIRAHLQAAAQAIGVIAAAPSTAPEVKAALLTFTTSIVGILSLGALLSCTPAQVAQAQTDTTQAIDLTNAVCTLAPDSPVGQQYVDVVCSLAQAGEQLVNVVIGVAQTLEGSGATTSSSAIARVPVEQIRFSIPTPSAAKFLAAHTKK